MKISSIAFGYIIEDLKDNIDYRTIVNNKYVRR